MVWKFKYRNAAKKRSETKLKSEYRCGKVEDRKRVIQSERGSIDGNGYQKRVKGNQTRGRFKDPEEMNKVETVKGERKK